MNLDLFKQWFYVGLRYITPYLAGYLATKFGVTTESAASAIAAVTTVVMFIWSIANKYRYETKVNTALNLPTTADKDTLKDVIAKGAGTSGLVNP